MIEKTQVSKKNQLSDTLNANKGKIAAGLLLTSLLLPSEIMAADLPAVVVVFATVVSSIVTKVVIGLVVLVMLVISAWEMKENGNARPLKWAIFASVVMGGAVFFGPSMIDFMTDQLSNVSGSNAIITTT